MVGSPFRRPHTFTHQFPIHLQSLHLRSSQRNNSNSKTGLVTRWALEFFSYDRLALVNTDAYQNVGGWETLIPFYGTDCDMHERLAMEGYAMNEWSAGAIWDVASSLDDLEVLYRKKGTPDPSFVDPNSVEEELAQANITLGSKSPNPRRQTAISGLEVYFRVR
ncbi:hypothetical protein DID88_008631 [Monilinia fructigena]|uniref:Uncharacterized protein n=1 Tax=Monilinia fructigena TaxID=38457 RepID=A0A395J6M1_9HELO|nr:hypothetical protein DID88_008631 [Monilinia fructigena]